MITEDKITEIFCMADDFCKIYDKFIKVNGLGPKRDNKKREYHRDPKLSDSEVLTIMILFHFSGYKCLKHFYTQHVCIQCGTCSRSLCRTTGSRSWKGRCPCR